MIKVRVEQRKPARSPNVPFFTQQSHPSAIFAAEKNSPEQEQDDRAYRGDDDPTEVK